MEEMFLQVEVAFQMLSCIGGRSNSVIGILFVYCPLGGNNTMTKTASEVQFFVASMIIRYSVGTSFHYQLILSYSARTTVLMSVCTRRSIHCKLVHFLLHAVG